MKFLLGFFSALAILALAGFAIVWTGIYNVAATDPHFDPMRWALDTTFHNSVRLRADDIQAPAGFTPDQVQEGFKTFDSMCVQCHGAPGVERTEWAMGMRPVPPPLSEEATHWNAAEIFWILRNGVKMSGMPALGPTHDDQTLWNAVAFVQQLPSMTPEAYAQLRQEIGSGGHHGSGGGQPAGGHHGPSDGHGGSTAGHESAGEHNSGSTGSTNEPRAHQHSGQEAR